MGYREDGNFSIDWDWDGAAEGKQYAQQNAPFIYPDKGIRFLQGQAALDAAMKRVNTISRGDYTLHRGYIRNLEQPAWGAVPITRCNFQFNPQQISQNVAMREDVYLPMLQPPEQLAQPLGANVNFSFDLLFDRSHELAKGRDATINPDTGMMSPGGGQVTSDANAIGLNDAYDIGVLADLRVFYSVIGQGFSKEMIDFQAKMFEYNAYNELNGDTNQPSGDGTTTGTDGESTEGENTSSDTSTPPTTQNSPDMTEIERLINSNIGNFALLMPMPVRVMFSSLFMVDGFVTNTSVDFLKFSTKMVPVQCRIGVSMNAMYIGFARQTTYLTDVFDRAAKAIQDRNAEDEQARKELLEALRLTCGSFIIGASLELMSTGYVVDWDNAATLNHTREMPVWTLAVSDEVLKRATKARNLFLGFPKVKPVKGGDIDIVVRGESIKIKEGEDIDAILVLYKAGVAINFSYTWNVTVHGRKPGDENLPPLTEKMAKDYMNGLLDEKTIQKEGIKVLGSYSGTETSSDEKKWGQGTGGDSGSDKVRRRSIRGSEFTNTSPDAYQYGFVDSQYSDAAPWGEASYFMVEISVNFSVSSGGGTPVTASYSYKQVFKGDQDIDRKIVVGWDSGPTSSDTDPYIPRDELTDPR